MRRRIRDEPIAVEPETVGGEKRKASRRGGSNTLVGRAGRHARMLCRVRGHFDHPCDAPCEGCRDEADALFGIRRVRRRVGGDDRRTK